MKKNDQNETESQTDDKKISVCPQIIFQITSEDAKLQDDQRKKFFLINSLN